MNTSLKINKTLDLTRQKYGNYIRKNLDSCVTKTNYNYNFIKSGKVRDIYEVKGDNYDDDLLMFVSTDRLSAFDKSITHIPFKGELVNKISNFWFNETQHFCKNSLIGTPEPNVSLMRRLNPIPIEFIIRQYLTGVTDTSMWSEYSNGRRIYNDLILPNGMKKNDKLHRLFITPTTKDVHDKPIDLEDIIKEEILSKEDLSIIKHKCFRLFIEGYKKCMKDGLLLVDTKYEFGKDRYGNIFLIDEIHTPDSSRFWYAEDYEHCIKHGIEPENLDKEFFRKFYKENVANIDKEIPEDIIIETCLRYIFVYETLTGKSFRNIEQLNI